MKKLAAAVMITLSLFLLIASTGCLAIGEPNVATMAPSETANVKKVWTTADYMEQVMPNWFLGIVYQVKYNPAFGINADDYNRVRLDVYIPNGILTLIPSSSRQEKFFATNLKPGDIIAFRVRKTNAYDEFMNFLPGQGVIRVYKDDIAIIEPNGVANLSKK